MRYSGAHLGDSRPFRSLGVKTPLTMPIMGGVPPTHDAVRIYLDSAVAEAAERWVGRATDATAYADLVAAVLARREALSPVVPRPEYVGPERPPARPEAARHHERRSRPRWPLGSPPPPAPVDPGPSPADTSTPAETGAVPPGPDQSATGALVGAAAPSAPTGPPMSAAPSDAGLPIRPPGRHRTPPPPPEQPAQIDLNDRLTTVLDWLGRPEA